MVSSDLKAKVQKSASGFDSLHLHQFNNGGDFLYSYKCEKCGRFIKKEDVAKTMN